MNRFLSKKHTSDKFYFNNETNLSAIKYPVKKKIRLGLIANATKLFLLWLQLDWK